MQKKEKPRQPKLRKVWEIDPATKVHGNRNRYNRHKEKEKLRGGLGEEEEEEEEEEEQEEEEEGPLAWSGPR